MSPDIHVDDWQRRPQPRQQNPLPPFDQNDPDGLQVHTTQPPELVIPPGPDPLFLRADFNGVTIPGDYEPKGSDAVIAAGGITMTSGRWSGLHIPFLAGANSTPPTMLMTPMLPLYPQDVIDAVLTEHAERDYSHLIWDPEVWNAAANGRSFSPDDSVNFGKYLQSWGFFPTAWRGNPVADDPHLKALVVARAVAFFCIGEEVDRKFTSEAYTAILENNLAIADGVPCGAHFTVNGPPDFRSYPLSFPRDTFINDWSKYNGRLHLCLQSAVDATAAQQASLAYYARMHVNCGMGDAAHGPGAPDSRVFAWEVGAEAQLYGRLTEEQVCLRSLELLFATRNHGCVRPMGGFGNGCRQPNGDPL